MGGGDVYMVLHHPGRVCCVVGRPISTRQPPGTQTSVDAEVSSLLEAMEHHAGGSRKTTDRSSTGPLARTPSGDVLPSTDRNTQGGDMGGSAKGVEGDRVIVEYDEMHQLPESSSSSDEEDVGDVWDPRNATPVRPRRGVSTRGGGASTTTAGGRCSCSVGGCCSEGTTPWGWRVVIANMHIFSTHTIHTFDTHTHIRQPTKANTNNTTHTTQAPSIVVKAVVAVIPLPLVPCRTSMHAATSMVNPHSPA